jgi:quercetin dioxygenase-like cupin family protein
MHTRSARGVFLLIVLLLASALYVSADSMANPSDLGVVIQASDLNAAGEKGFVSAFDIIPLLKSSEIVNVSMPASLTIFSLEPGRSFSPSAIRPASEIIYLMSGTAEVSAGDVVMAAKAGEGLLVPAQSMMIVKNTGTSPLTYLSIISSTPDEDVIGQKMLKRSLSGSPPVTFGSLIDPNYFTVYRLFSTFEEPLPLSFDLAVASLPAGKVIANHYLSSGQLGYVMSGTGNVTIGCTDNQVSPGDIVYVPPYAVQSYRASEDLMVLLITEPFYRPDQDYPADDACSTGINEPAA